MNKEINRGESIEVRLLFREIMKHWKSILVVSIIFAVIFPVFKYVIDPPKSSAEVVGAETESTDVADDEDSPEIAALKNELVILNSNKEYLDTYLSEIEEQYKEQLRYKEEFEEYKTTSVLLNIDPYNVAKSIKTYTLAPVEGMDAGTKANILTEYVQAATEANEADNETLNISNSDISICGITADDNSITISIIAPDDKMAEKYMKNASDAIESIKDTVLKEYGDHMLVLSDDSSFIAEDDNLRLAQEGYEKSINSSINSTKDKLLSLRTNQYSISTQIRTTETNIRTASNTSEASKNDPIVAGEADYPGTTKKDLVIWTIIGGAVGMILASMYYRIKYFLSDTLKSEKEIIERYGLRVWRVSEDKEKRDVTFAIIEKLVHDNKELLLASTQGEETCRAFEKSLNEWIPEIETVVTGNLNANSDGIKQLKESRKVLLIECADKSSLKAIINEIEIIKLSGSEIVGCMLYNQ